MTLHVADETCPDCGAAMDAPRPMRRPVLLRVAVGLVLLALVGTAVGAYWNARQRKERKAEIWRLSDAAFAAVKEERFADALPILERYTEARPRDAQMLYLLAVTRRQLSPQEPLAGVEAARSALAVDPSMSEAASFLAHGFEASGDVERALRYAEQAVAGSRPRGADHRLLAVLHLRRERPDVDAAVASLRRALAEAPDDPRLVVFLALLEMRRVGAVRADVLPPELLALVAKAERIVLEADAELAAEPMIRLAEVELAVAHRRHAPARRLAERLVAEPDLRPDIAVRARILLGRAALAEKDVGAARDAFAEALRRAPAQATAIDVARACRAAASPGMAVELIRGALLSPEPDPRMRDVLALLLLELGETRAALAELRTACEERPDDVGLMIRLGDALASSGDLDGADAAYAGAEARASPEDPEPALRRALVSVARASTARERRAVARAQVAELDTRFGDPERWTDADLLESRGRLAALADRGAEAVALLRRALDAAPQDPLVRISLAEAILVEGAPEGLSDADRLLTEASELAPYDERCVVRAARLMIAIGDPRRANSICQRFLDRIGDRPEVLDAAALALRRLGRWEDVADRLQRRARIEGDLSAALLRGVVDALLRAGQTRRARLLVSTSQHADAASDLETLFALRGVTDDERLARLRAGKPGLELAYALLARGERDEALETLRRAHGADPGDVSILKALVLYLLDAEGGPDRRSVEEARELAVRTPATAPAGTVESLRGAVALAAGDPETARELLELAAGALPDDPVANHLYGRALFESGRRREAVSALRRAASLPGALPGCSLALAQCLHRLARDTSDPAERESLLWEALTHDTYHVGASVDLVNLLHRAGRGVEAARLARRLVATTELDAELAHDLRRLAIAATLRATGLGVLVERVDDLPLDDIEAADGLTDGLLLLRAGRASEAAQLLADVRRRHPQSSIAIIGGIEAHVRAGNPEAARAEAAAADAREPGSIRYRVALVEALLRARRHGEALEVAADLQADTAPDIRLVEAIVLASLRTGRVEGALAAVEDAVAQAQGPTLVRLRLLRVAVLREHGRAEQALREARELAASLDGDSDLRSRARLAEAEVLVRLRRFDEAADVFASAGALPGPDAPDATRLAVRAAFVRGVLAMVEGHLDEAERAFREAVRLDSTEPAAANNLAWLLSGRPGFEAEALALARRATLQEPGNAEYWDTRAICARQAGHRDEAETCWRTAVELMGSAGAQSGELRLDVWTGLSELLAELGRFDEAVELARRVLEADPPPELARRARAILRLG